MNRPVSREEFEALYGGSGLIRPDASVQWTDKAAHPFWENYLSRASDAVANDFDLAYSRFRKDGLSHEASVQAAQRMLGRPVSELVGAENSYNSLIARMPLEMPLQVQGRSTAAPLQPKSRRGEGSTDRQLAVLQVLMAANPALAEAVASLPESAPEAPRTGEVLEQAVTQASTQKPPRGASGKRMAMRIGLPALGAFLGLYGLAAATDGNRAQEEREVARV